MQHGISSFRIFLRVFMPWQIGNVHKNNPELVDLDGIVCVIATCLLIYIYFISFV